MTIEFFKVIEWIASSLGVISVYIITSKQATLRKWRLSSFILGLTSNSFMISFCVHCQHWGLLSFNLIMFGLSLRGIVNNFSEKI